MAADSISFGDNDPVYIVFLSDGDPTVRISDPDADGRQHRIDPATGSQFTTEFGPVWGNGSETNSGVNFTPADNYALNTIIPHKVLFTGGFGSATEKMGQLVNNGYYRGQPDEFGHSNDLSAAFHDIVGSITTRVGYSDVEITDGITGMTSTTLVNGNPQDFTYKVTVPGENNTVRDITDEVLTPEQKNASYTVSGDDPKESGRVTWDLGDTLLADGATYSVSFIVWPDQDAYDLVSDLNNGLRSWSSLDETELFQIAGSGPNGDQVPYSLRTNTQAGVTYYPTIEVANSNGEKTHTKGEKGEIPLLPPDPMELTDAMVTIRKVWEDSLDTSQFEDLMAENPDYTAEFTLMKESEPYIEDISIKAPEELSRVWPELDGDGNEIWYHISAGLMVSQEAALVSGLNVTGYPTAEYNGTTYHILDSGRNYKFEEGSSDYHFELEDKVFRPMVVDGQLKNVTFEGSTVTGIEPLSTLTATNRLKGGINIYKKLVDAEGEEITTDQTCVFTLHGSITKNGQGTRLEYRIYGDEYTDETGAPGRTEKKTITNSASFSLELRAKDWIRIINVPSGYSYSFNEEVPENVPYTFSSIEGEAVDVNGEDVAVPAPGIVVSDNGTTLTGITVGNAAQNIIVTNTGIGKKLILKKVGISEDDPDQNEIDLGNVSFTIYHAAGAGQDQKGDVVTLGEGADAVELRNLLSDDITGEFFSGVLPYGSYLIEEDEVPAEYYHMRMLRLTVAAEGVTLTQATEGETEAVIDPPVKEENTGDTEIWTVKAVNVKKAGSEQGTTVPDGEITLFPHKQIDYLGDGGTDSDDLTTAYQNDDNAKNDLYRLYLDMTYSNKASNANIIFVEDWSSSMTNTDMGDSKTRYQHMQEALTETDGFIDSVLEEGSGNMLSVVKFSDYRDTHNGIADGTGVVLNWTAAAEEEDDNNTIKNAIKRVINQPYVNTPANTDGLQETVGHQDYSRWTNYQACLEMVAQQISALPEERRDKKTYVFFMSDGLPTVYGTSGNERGGYIPAWVYQTQHRWYGDNINYSEAFVYGKEKYQNLVGQGNTKGVLEMTKGVIDTFKANEDYRNLIINAVGFAGNMPNDIRADDISTFHTQQNGDNYPKSRISNNAFCLPSTNGYLQYNSVLRYLADGRGEYRNAANGSELAQALKEMFEQKPITQVEISDTLSDFVELYGRAPDFAVTKNGTKLTVTEAADGSYTVKDGTTDVGRITWDPQTKEVRLDFEDDLAYEHDDRYVLSFNVEASTRAYEAFAASKVHDGASSGYNAFGDKGTDYGSNLTSYGGEEAHIGHPGFRSNKSAELTYKFGDTEKEESYPHPVIQVGETNLDVQKQWVGNGGQHPEGVTEVKFRLWAEDPVTGERKQIMNAGDSHGYFILSQNTDPDKNWKLSVHHLVPKVLADPGTEQARYEAVRYSLEEVDVPEGYTVSYQFDRKESSDPAVFENISNNYEADGNLHIYQVPASGSAAAGSGSGRIINTAEERETSVTIRKTDHSAYGTNYLENAVFKLYYGASASDTWVNASRELIAELDAESRFTVPRDGITLIGLTEGQYRLQEVMPPEGYVITNEYPVVFTVQGGAVTGTEGTAGNVRFIEEGASAAVTFVIPNEPGAALPSTGGLGTWFLSFLGSVLIAGAGLLVKMRPLT